MKKSLIALAVLGATLGAAHAQSTVTLYGRIDMSVMHNNVFGGASQASVDSGTVSGSRWGLSGSEDLGGGLKANFNLEQGFTADNGLAAVAGQAFSRQSWVGFSGAFGEFRMGKPWTAYDDVSGAHNAMFDSGFSVENNFFASTGYSANPANTLRYSTPTFGGFSASVSYSLDEVANAKGNIRSISGLFATGPLQLAAGHQVEELGATSQKFTRLSGSYDFGSFVLKGLYGHVKLPVAGKTTEYSIGADFPVSGALTVSGSFGQSRDSVAAGSEKRKGLTIGALYAISKRTDFYVGITDWNGKTGGVKTDGNTRYGLGARHSF
jgi:predicted porin